LCKRHTNQSCDHKSSHNKGSHPDGCQVESVVIKDRCSLALLLNFFKHSSAIVRQMGFWALMQALVALCLCVLFAADGNLVGAFLSLCMAAITLLNSALGV
jgi:hypothetical protein